MKTRSSIDRKAMVLILLAFPLFSRAQKQIDLSFDGIKTVLMTPPKGSCQVRRSKDLKTRVVLTTKYKSEQVPRYTVAQAGDSLIIKEKNHPGSVSGSTPQWVVWVPQATSVIYKTGNGSFDAGDLNTNLLVETGKGNINISQSRGVFKLSTANGDINVTNLTLSGASEFNAEKGDCAISLEASPQNDLRISSGSGNITLDMKDHQINAKLILQLGKRSKAIVPFPLVDGKTIVEEDNNETWTEKSLSLGADNNEILLRSGNGIIKLIK